MKCWPNLAAGRYLAKRHLSSSRISPNHDFLGFSGTIPEGDFDPMCQACSHSGYSRGNPFTRPILWLSLVTAATLIGLATEARADEPKPSVPANPARAERIRDLAERGIDYLKSQGQAANGAFSPESGAAVTSLCVSAILRHRPEAINDPAIEQALAFIESNIRSDGGIHAEGSLYKNYETCVAVDALIQANRNQKYDSVLERARLFIRGLQWDESEGLTAKDAAYGGAGYGTHQRPDLSNTSFMVEALRQLGDQADDEAIQKALMFISRTQNLAGHGNDTQHAEAIGDGGFYYTPAAGGSSQAGATAEGGLRSYASMTYAGFKSMIFAGLTADDPRVAAALDFIRKNYSLETNPGMGDAGLYYYYHTFAKALDAAKMDILDDAEGKPHVWRDELVDTLAGQQLPDGSWVNKKNERWMEGNRNLVTAYSLLALAYCR